MSGDILQTPDAPKPQGALDNYFKITARGSTVRQEVLAGLTTFLAMVYSVIVVPGMLGKAGFPPAAVFVATCLVAGFGSLLMGLWANLPMAIGCAISLTAFTAFSLVLGQQISVPVALGAVFLMGVIFTAISVTGVRTWILRNLPMGIAHGTGIGIGLFLLLIAANGVGMVIKNPIEGLPVALGAFTSFPVMMSLLGLAVIFGLEKCRVPGGILLVIIAISIIGLIFDPAVKYHGLVAMPSLTGEDSPRLSARRFLSERILTAGNNTLLADSPEFSFSKQLQRLCWARFNAGWPLFPLFTEIAFHNLLSGIPRQRLNGDHSKRARTDATLTANTTGRIGLHHLLAHRQRPHGASANTRGVFTLMAHHRRTDAVQSLYLQPG